MRLWHTAGIRPVISPFHVRLQSCPPPALRSLRKTWAPLRHKSEAAKDSSKVDGDEDEAVDRALQNILSSLRHSEQSTPPQPSQSSQTSFEKPQGQSPVADAPEGLTLGQFFSSIQPSSAVEQPSPQNSDVVTEGPSASSKKVKSKLRRLSSKPVRQTTIRPGQSVSTEQLRSHPSTLSRNPLRLGSDVTGDEEQKDRAENSETQPGEADETKETAEVAEGAEVAEAADIANGEQVVARVQEQGPTARRRRNRLRRRLAARSAKEQDDIKQPNVSKQAKPPPSYINHMQSTSSTQSPVESSDHAQSGHSQSPFASPQSQSIQDALKGKTFEMGVSQDNPEPLKFRMAASIETLKASDIVLTPLPVEQPPVPRLNHGLDRVLFNKGVYQLQDPDSMVYNFDPYLQKIMPVAEFDFNALAEYKTSSQDGLLSSIAKEHNIKYVGSTSSMTSTLGHFHYLLSNWRPINIDMLSKGFPESAVGFTEINKAPNSIFLRWKKGTYAIDADKEYDGANVLMLLGKSLEKLLTMPSSDFERYRKSDPREVTEAERTAPDSFHFSTQGDFLMRSQLDAHDPRLPGTGMFDLKTRAVVSVRMQSSDYEEMSDYELHKQHGRFESYEREYYDMCRSTMLKYSLQARMGRMDGIFVAYHNVKRIFGFQYLNLNEMDRALHGQFDRSLGNQEFSLSIDLLNKILNKATERYPEQSLRFHFETRIGTLPFMYVFAEPMGEEDIDKIQNSQKEKVAEYERLVMGIEKPPASEEPAAEVAVAEDEGSAIHDAQVESTKIESGTLKITEADDTQAASAVSPVAVETRSADGLVEETSTDESVEDSSVVSTVDAPKSSDSPADKAFLTMLDPSNKTVEENLRPLLAMTLTVRSRVNGAYVERPQDLSPSDEWSVEYALSEISSPSRAWSLYEASKARRRRVYERMNAVKKQDDERTDEERKRDRRNQEYMQMLRELSLKGKELRGKIEMLELERDKVVVGQPYGKVDERVGGLHTAKSPDVDIKGVDDYLGWLFGTGSGRA